MKPSIIVNGVSYFPIVASGCDIMVGKHYFECAHAGRREDGCKLPLGNSACTPNASGTGRSIIHLTKEQHVLAVMLGAEAPT